ncbi:hypothetical protein BDZ91DRAFT_711887 [Kalaharituber pfeilii]|nr:hypothetical protein BDZ91DRAFT_711887 [Kalaharituber pfeilii]
MKPNSYLICGMHLILTVHTDTGHPSLGFCVALRAPCASRLATRRDGGGFSALCAHWENVVRFRRAPGLFSVSLVPSLRRSSV